MGRARRSTLIPLRGAAATGTANGRCEKPTETELLLSFRSADRPVRSTSRGSLDGRFAWACTCTVQRSSHLPAKTRAWMNLVVSYNFERKKFQEVAVSICYFQNFDTKTQVPEKISINLRTPSKFARRIFHCLQLGNR